jgi:hypothetical protein
MNTRRLGIEALVAVLLVLGAAGVWWWKGREAAEAARQGQARTAAVAKEAEMWAAKLADDGAKSTFQSFAAGVAPAVLAERVESVDQAVVGLLEVSGVVFVHILAPDGGVIASSDRKLQAAGQVGEEAGWVFAADGVKTRPSDRTGVLELAAPIVGPAGPKAYLWMGYDTASTIEQTRPEGWEGWASAP